MDFQNLIYFIAAFSFQDPHAAIDVYAAMFNINNIMYFSISIQLNLFFSDHSERCNTNHLLIIATWLYQFKLQAKWQNSIIIIICTSLKARRWVTILTN